MQKEKKNLIIEMPNVALPILLLFPSVHLTLLPWICNRREDTNYMSGSFAKKVAGAEYTGKRI